MATKLDIVVTKSNYLFFGLKPGALARALHNIRYGIPTRPVDNSPPRWRLVRPRRGLSTVLQILELDHAAARTTSRAINPSPGRPFRHRPRRQPERVAGIRGRCAAECARPGAPPTGAQGMEPPGRESSSRICGRFSGWADELQRIRERGSAAGCSWMFARGAGRFKNQVCLALARGRLAMQPACATLHKAARA